MNGPSPFSVSTNPAACTADVSVVRYGLFDAAEATGLSAIPTNEPSPSGGIDEQKGPSGPLFVTATVVLASAGRRRTVVGPGFRQAGRCNHPHGEHHRQRAAYGLIVFPCWPSWNRQTDFNEERANSSTSRRPYPPSAFRQQ